MKLSKYNSFNKAVKILLKEEKKLFEAYNKLFSSIIISAEMCDEILNEEKDGNLCRLVQRLDERVYTKMIVYHLKGHDKNVITDRLGYIKSLASHCVSFDSFEKNAYNYFAQLWRVYADEVVAYTTKSCNLDVACSMFVYKLTQAFKEDKVSRKQTIELMEKIKIVHKGALRLNFSSKRQERILRDKYRKYQSLKQTEVEFPFENE